MSGDVVERAKAALEGIRPEPWQVIGYGNLHAGEPGEHPPLGKVYGMANAAFIAAARSLVPELVSHINELEAALSASESYLAQEVRENARLRAAGSTPTEQEKP